MNKEEIVGWIVVVLVFSVAIWLIYTLFIVKVECDANPYTKWDYMSGKCIAENELTIAEDLLLSDEKKGCHINESQDDWHCTEPCSCLFVDKMLICNETGQSVVKSVYSDLNREAWIRCNQNIMQRIVEMDKNQNAG